MNNAHARPSVQQPTARARASADASPRQRERELRLFISHAPVALAMFDRDMRYLAASRRWKTEYGLIGSRLRGRHQYEVFPDLPEHYKAIHRRALAGHAARATEDRYDRADGSVRWLHWEVRPWRDAQRRVGGVVIFTEDITAQKTAEQQMRALNAELEARVAERTAALAESERRFRGLFEGSTTAISLIDLDTGQQQCNPALRALLGYTEDELRLIEPLSLVHPEDRDENRALLARLTRGEVSSFAVENRYLRKDGSPVWVDKHASVLAGADGKPARLVVFAHDATERHGLFETLNARLESAMRSHVAGQTVAAIAHELNQPLVAIGLYCETALRLLERGPADAGRLREAVAGAAEQAQRAGAAMRELMAVAARGVTPTEPLDLGALVERVALRLREDHAHAFDVVLEVPKALPRALGHARQLEKALAILIENSAESMAAGGGAAPAITARVQALDGEGLVQASVADNGPGIDPALRERLFEPFSTTKPHGLGMGLAVCRSMIEAQGGRLWAEPAPGTGAAFHFTLPVAP